MPEGRPDGRRRPPVIVPCTACGKPFGLNYGQRSYWKQAGRAFCSEPCRLAGRRRTPFRWQVPGELEARLREYAAAHHMAIDEAVTLAVLELIGDEAPER